MRDPQSIECIFSRLMPPALSQRAQSEIEAIIDDLAGDPAAPTSPRRWPVAAAGIAAALAAGFLIAQAIQREFPQLADIHGTGQIPEFTLVSESGRIQDMVDEGWGETPDGGTVRQLRLRVLEESRLLDQETGIVMNISQPREEYLLMPVSAF
jgi:hypothetical protein